MAMAMAQILDQGRLLHGQQQMLSTEIGSNSIAARWTSLITHRQILAPMREKVRSPSVS
ncbi:hypothetical protein SAMN05216410_1332 [Sanguibacter gelidistatuariae]|uniref:Uncharacterized protein n=2 Tax=Sanguibacter gelidistatuariae TaxID=1814289 RepID=A0A1G6JGG0_9MICO|nr:hypothetical protein SAMN05216410_1332 [Sanguibacter gelidistatuariae]